MSDADDRVAVLEKYKKVVRDHREMETRLKNNRESVKDLGKEYQQTEDALKALQVRRPRPISAATCSRARRLASLQTPVAFGKLAPAPDPQLSPCPFVLQSVGQIIGDILKQLDDTRFIVKVNAPRPNPCDPCDPCSSPSHMPAGLASHRSLLLSSSPLSLSFSLSPPPLSGVGRRRQGPGMWSAAGISWTRMR